MSAIAESEQEASTGKPSVAALLARFGDAKKRSQQPLLSPQPSPPSRANSLLQLAGDAPSTEVNANAPPWAKAKAALRKLAQAGEGAAKQPAASPSAEASPASPPGAPPLSASSNLLRAPSEPQTPELGRGAGQPIPATSSSSSLAARIEAFQQQKSPGGQPQWAPSPPGASRAPQEPGRRSAQLPPQRQQRAEGALGADSLERLAAVLAQAEARATAAVKQAAEASARAAEAQAAAAAAVKLVAEATAELNEARAAAAAPRPGAAGGAAPASAPHPTPAPPEPTPAGAEAEPAPSEVTWDESLPELPPMPSAEASFVLPAAMRRLQSDALNRFGPPFVAADDGLGSPGAAHAEPEPGDGDASPDAADGANAAGGGKRDRRASLQRDRPGTAAGEAPSPLSPESEEGSPAEEAVTPPRPDPSAAATATDSASAAGPRHPHQQPPPAGHSPIKRAAAQAHGPPLREAGPCPDLGIALWALRDFVEHYADELRGGAATAPSVSASILRVSQQPKAAGPERPVPPARAGPPVSTAQVCQAIVKPATAAAQCSYAELLRAEAAAARAGADAAADAEVAAALGADRPLPRRRRPRQPVGRATLFVSHACENPFVDLVEAVEAHAEASGRGASGGKAAAAAETFVWCAGLPGAAVLALLKASTPSFLLTLTGPRAAARRLDVFSLCQHSRGCAARGKPWSCPCGSARDPPGLGWVTNSLRDAIRAAGRVAVVLDPWAHPAALSRAWCLWRVAALPPAAALAPTLTPPTFCTPAHKQPSG